MDTAHPEYVDLLVVGGGINGVGIARDAAGRGLKVLLVEKDDLGSATSSASSKLIHGGLRYLEQYRFRLVAEALAEREVLLRSAPHIVHPMRFVMPHVPQLRPAWVIRAGLFLYDYLARRQTLPGSRAIDLTRSPYGVGLKPGLVKGFVYSDCWVDDARLVVLTARAAADAGATISTRTECTSARREGKAWQVSLSAADGTSTEIRAGALANVTGPWARLFLEEVMGLAAPFNLKLVKGSHVIVPRLYDSDHAFILQNEDRRVIFVYPYERNYTLIGTTDVELAGRPGPCAPSAAEESYLIRAVNRYFTRQLKTEEVVWSYCGIRPLFDDGAANPSEVTRDYVLRVDGGPREPPVLSVFGGKITTYRRLAEQALRKLAPWFPDLGRPWTGSARLPGGDMAGGLEAYVRDLAQRHPALPATLLMTLARRHGSLCPGVLGGARSIDDLGEHFGAALYAREVDYFMDREWARADGDVLWRRTKAGLHLSADQARAVARYMALRTSGTMR
ncbi:MAG: glycerol-3-phosphate dehydrogenase [Betaproteobacteria bacterium]|nr:glycerol-3-phosphate dehydrogenase [Betaproteobacteria bacterium]